MTRPHSMNFCDAPWMSGCSQPFRPDPLQGLSELPLIHRSWCPLRLEDAADPPDLETAKGKGEQTQLEVSPVQVVHHDAFWSFCQLRSRDRLNWFVFIAVLMPR
jgi:hypothetical protein